MITTEPIVLSGEGEYKLYDIKEVKVTDSYLQLHQEDKKCQNDEPFLNCTTKHYIENILGKCGCLPFNLKYHDKVCIQNKTK